MSDDGEFCGKCSERWWNRSGEEVGDGFLLEGEWMHGCKRCVERSSNGKDLSSIRVCTMNKSNK